MLFLSLFKSVGISIVTGAKYIFSPGRRKVTLAAMTVALILALVLWINHSRSVAAQAVTRAAAAEAASKVLVAARRADDAALATSGAIKGAAVSQEAISSAKTETALAGVPAWADEPVPPAVLNSLRE